MTDGTVQPTRATVHCQTQCIRLNTLYAYLNALTIEGGKAKDAVATTDKERKEYLGKERMKGIYQQCPHCCAGEIEEYQLKLEYGNPTSMDGEDSNNTLNKNYGTSNPNRKTLTHVQTCIHPSIAKDMKLGSDHIEQKLIQLYKIAEERQKEAYVATSDGTPTLRTHMLAHLKCTELLPHKTTSDSRPYKRCVYTTRAGNTTIRSIQSWHTTNEGKANGKDITTCSTAGHYR